MTHKAIVVGGGMSGMSCALELQKAGIDYRLITDVLGGRVCYSEEEKVNFGAYFIMANYKNAKRLVTRETRLNPFTACFHNSASEFFPMLSLHSLAQLPGFLRFRKMMNKFSRHYESYKDDCLVMPQREALERDPYLKELFTKPASDFIRENRIQRLADDYISKFSYACTGVSMDKITALDFCNVSMGVMVPIHRFKFDASGMAQWFGENLVIDTIEKIESSGSTGGIHKLTARSGEIYEAGNVVFATPAAVTKELLGLGQIRETCQLYVFHVTAKLKPNFARYEMNLFPFESEIIFTSVQDDGSFLIYTREREADLGQVCESYQLISMKAWDRAMYVHGRAYVEQEHDNGIFVAGDHNGLGLEPTAISGIYAANRIIEQNRRK